MPKVAPSPRRRLLPFLHPWHARHRRPGHAGAGDGSAATPGYCIYFSKRGKQDRTAALRLSLEQARERFSRARGIHSTAPISVLPRTSVDCPGLQAVDYFLWALQRLYERREDRYVAYLQFGFCMVHDLDDTRQSRHGVYYTKKKPLTIAALEDLPGI